MSARQDGELDEDTLDLMCEQVGQGALAELDPALVWQEIARGLSGSLPSRMLRTLRECDALTVLLPEVDALFGAPQIADEPAQVAIGEHLLRMLDEAVRYAALVFNVGKSDSPREHLPVHYKGRPQVATRHVQATSFVPGRIAGQVRSHEAGLRSRSG